MTARKPFVNVNGQIQEISDSDSLAGLAPSSTIFSLSNGELSAQSLADFSSSFSVVNGEILFESVTPSNRLNVLTRDGTNIIISVASVLPVLNRSGTVIGVTL